MASVFRRREKGRPVPANAKLSKFQHNVATAKWTDAQNRQHTALVERDESAALVRLSKTFYCNFRDERGVVQTITTGMTNADAAESFLNQRLAIIEKIKLGLITRADLDQREHGKQPIQSHLDDFMRSRPGTLSVKRLATLEQMLSDFITESGIQTLPGLNQENVERWLNEQIVARRRGLPTLSNFVTAIKMLAKWCARTKRLATTQGVEFVEIQKPHSDRRHVRRAFTRGEFEKLLSVASPEWRDTYIVAAHTGLRANELKTLRCCDITGLGTGHATIELESANTKNRKADKLPCHPIVEQLAIRRIREHGLKPTDPLLFVGTATGRTVRRYCRRAGVEVVDAKGRTLDFHSLRQTFVTWLATSGVDLRTVQQLARHANIQLTAKTYCDVSQLPTREAVLSAFGDVNGRVNNGAATRHSETVFTVFEPHQTVEANPAKLDVEIDVTTMQENCLHDDCVGDFQHSSPRADRQCEIELKLASFRLSAGTTLFYFI